MKPTKHLLFGFFIFGYVFAYGQEVLSSEIVDRINNTAKQDIFSVAETVKFDKQILRAGEIVFAPDAVLELTNMDYPYIVLAADKIKFTAPLKRASIKRSFDIFATNGIRGNAGSDGASGGRSGRHGRKGGNGGDGSKGGNGGTKSLPTIYLITNEVVSQESEDAPDYINLRLIFPGIDGGTGGPGGTGGKGGRGGSGRDGSDSPIDCRSGAGDGGNGGNAGRGGQGGDGGTGGKGADIVLIGSEQALEILSYAVIINTGGYGGIPGTPGPAGTPGDGGRRGGSSTYCGWGDHGSEGSLPNPSNLGPGKAGMDGEKGKVTTYSITNFSILSF